MLGSTLHWLRVCLILSLFASSIMVRAQKSSQPPDPFEQMNAEIAHAAEERLIEVGQPDPAVSDNPLTFAAAPAPTNFALVTLADRANDAALRLEAFGINAKEIFRQAGVPTELLTVAEVESGFQPRALSPKGALGLWQFMPETARRYGLRVDGQVDDRLNPELETRAAARYLHDLYLRFRDWPLALAAYNAGENTVQAAIMQHGTMDFWALRQWHLLPEETRSYVPAILGSELQTETATRLALKHPVDSIPQGYEVFAQSNKEDLR